MELGNPLALGKGIAIEVENIANTDGVVSPIKSNLKVSYEDYVEEVFASDPNTIFIQSSLPIDPDEIKNLSFEIEEIPQFKFNVSSSDHFQLKLQTDLKFEEDINYTLNLPPRKSDRGLFIPGSSHSFVYDITPPELVDVILLGEDKLLLVFSEEVDPVYASILSNYILSGSSPEQVNISGHQIILSWNFNFIFGQVYELEINKISDLNGNFSENIRKTFTTNQVLEIAFKDLVINEVMPAPRAGNILPNVEYVEIFNATDNPIYLGGLQLANSRRVSILPSAVIDPNAYIILSPRSQSSQFEKYGKVIGLANWPTLLNAADQVKLFNKDGRVLDSLNYNTSSFGSPAYATGGYSLEIANPFLKCYLPTNIKVSQHPDRGTPGKVNSVYEEKPDLSAPKFLNARVIENNSVSLNFNKVLNQDLRNVRLEINPHLRIKNIGIGTAPTSLMIYLDEDLKQSIKYSVSISHLRDCSGNLFEGKEEVYFVAPDQPTEGDIVINEVLFNPRAGAPKFVEIYNASSKYLNLKDWKLANLNSSDEIANRRILFSEDKIIEPFSFVVFTTDVAKLKQEYPKGKENRFVGYSSLPSYPISAGNVILLNHDETLTEIFSYTEKMHHPLLKEKEGFP